MERMEGLYRPQWEHDACGIGAVIQIDGTKSHATVDKALKIVEKLEHRAGKDTKGETGDGVGIMVQIAHHFFTKVAAQQGIQLGEERDYGVGMFFFPQDNLLRSQARKMCRLSRSTCHSCSEPYSPSSAATTCSRSAGGVFVVNISRPPFPKH